MLKVTTAVASLIAAVAFASAPAQAQSAYQEQEQNWMVSAHLAKSSIDVTERWQDGGFFTIDDDDTSWGVSLSYRLWAGLSFRGTYERGLGYYSAGQPSCPDICTPITREHRGSLNHYSLTAVPEFALTPNLLGFASFGVAHTEVDTHRQLRNYSETTLTYGIGLGYQLTPAVFISTEYQTTGSEYDSLRVAVGYRF